MKSTSMPDTRSIAVFDSGSGGLTVLKALRALAPEADTVYCADTAYLPYGNKVPAVIEQRMLDITRELIERENIAGLIVACNTATALGIETLRKAFEIPIIGIEPGIKPAVELSKNKCVGVFATEATIASERFRTFMNSYQKLAEIYPVACPSFVPLVERLLLSATVDSELIAEIETAVAYHVEQLREVSNGEIDVIALGCTHYPILIKFITEYINKKNYNIRLIATSIPVSKYSLNEIKLFTKNGIANFYETNKIIKNKSETSILKMSDKLQAKFYNFT